MIPYPYYIENTPKRLTFESFRAIMKLLRVEKTGKRPETVYSFFLSPLLESRIGQCK
jgi:hypothetical protein